MFRPPRIALVAALLTLALPFSAAGDWPNWRGPERDSTSAEEKLPLRWSAEDNLCWKAPMTALSGATPIVSGDRIFLQAADGERLELWSLAAKDGSVVWKRPLDGGNRIPRKHNLSSPSPVTDGEHVWVMTGTGVVAAFDFAGKMLWRRDLQKDYGPFGILWGYASSPLLVDGTLYIQVLHGMKTDDPSYVVALDGASGESRWKVERKTDALLESPDAYTTPVLLEVGERRELVISGADYVTGHDLASGKELWRVGGLNPNREKNYRLVGTPVVTGDLLIVPSRVSPLLALKIPPEGTPAVAWRLERAGDVPSPLTDGETLFIVNDRGILRRFDLDDGSELGEPLRLGAGNHSASPVLAGGHLYAIDEKGTTAVVKVGDPAEIVAENQTPGFTLASPAVADGRIYLRTDEFLYCVEMPPQTAPAR
ncbi:MAG: PQQ-binding-like beta-propeller repeat protein [Acidobacteriota bacterium]